MLMALGLFFNYCAVGEAFRGRVVNSDWSWWLQVHEFLEGSVYRHGLLAIVKSGTNSGFSGGRHHVVGDLGDGMDRAVERGVSESCLVGSVDWLPSK